MSKSSGSWKKGQTGNPKGSSRKARERHNVVVDDKGTTINLKEMCRAHAPDAINLLIEVVNNSQYPVSSRIQAANALLDRGFGRPEQTAHVDVKTSEPREMSLAALFSEVRTLASEIQRLAGGGAV